MQFFITIMTEKVTWLMAGTTVRGKKSIQEKIEE